MKEKSDLIKTNFNEATKKAIQFLESELTKIRAGRVSVNLLDDIKVEYYGANTPINQVANVSIIDARTLAILPWEKNMLGVIEKAILAANIGINPQNDGSQIRLYMPIVTEERRKELVKKSLAEGEKAKIVVRNQRREAIEQLQKLKKEGLSEDLTAANELDIQNITNKYITQIDKILKQKEEEITHI